MRNLRRVHAIAIALLVASTGCANLSAIRDFAKTSSDAANYRRIVDDYVTSPARRARYAPRDRPCPDCTRIAAERESQRDALLIEQQVLQEYMDALGELAADDLVDYSKEYTDLAAAAAKAKFLSENEGKAVATIANVLTKAATDAWRQRELKRIIESTNQPLQVVIQGLQTILDAFKKDLANEDFAAEDYYRTVTRESRDRAGIAALEEWHQIRAREIADRRAAVDTYKHVLATIGAGHQKLFNSRDDLAAKDTLAQIKAYARDLKKAYQALQDLKG